MSETALQPIPSTVPEHFAHQFMGTTPQIVELLPRDVPLSQFQAGLWMEFTTTPTLRECTPMSLIKAAIRAAMRGHVPGRDCFMIPFKNNGKLEATMVEYYQGIVRALDRTGRIAWAKAEPVYARDHFRCDELAEIYEFERHIDGDRGKLRCYFSAIKLYKADKPLVRVCTVEEVEKIRQSAPGRQQAPWQQWPEEMGKKTALKKHAKYLQLVPEDDEDTAIPAVNNTALLFGGNEANEAHLRATRPSVAAVLTEQAGQVASGNLLASGPLPPSDPLPPQAAGKTTVKLYEDRDQGENEAPVLGAPTENKTREPLDDISTKSNPPVGSERWCREEAATLVNDAAKQVNVTGGAIWDEIKRLVPKRFQLKGTPDLETIRGLLPAVVEAFRTASTVERGEVVAEQPITIVSQEEASTAQEVSPLDAWLGTMAKRHNSTPDAIIACLAEHDQDDLFGQAAGLDPFAELPECLTKMEAILEAAQAEHALTSVAQDATAD